MRPAGPPGKLPGVLRLAVLLTLLLAAGAHAAADAPLKTLKYKGGTYRLFGPTACLQSEGRATVRVTGPRIRSLRVQLQEVADFPPPPLTLGSNDDTAAPWGGTFALGELEPGQRYLLKARARTKPNGVALLVARVRACDAPAA